MFDSQLKITIILPVQHSRLESVPCKLMVRENALNFFIAKCLLDIDLLKGTFLVWCQTQLWLNGFLKYPFDNSFYQFDTYLKFIFLFLFIQLPINCTINAAFLVYFVDRFKNVIHNYFWTVCEFNYFVMTLWSQSCKILFLFQFVHIPPSFYDQQEFDLDVDCQIFTGQMTSSQQLKNV